MLHSKGANRVFQLVSVLLDSRCNWVIRSRLNIGWERVLTYNCDWTSNSMSRPILDGNTIFSSIRIKILKGLSERAVFKAGTKILNQGLRGRAYLVSLGLFRAHSPKTLLTFGRTTTAYSSSDKWVKFPMAPNSTNNPRCRKGAE